MRTLQTCALLTIFLFAAFAVAQSSAINEAITDLRNPDTAKRTRAALLLWDISAEKPDQVKTAAEALSQTVLDRNLNIRFIVIQTLRNIGPASKIAVPSLIKALDTFPGGTPPLEGPHRYYADARWAAAEALGAIGPDAREAIPALQQSLTDPSEMVRMAAAEALKQIQAN